MNINKSSLFQEFGFRRSIQDSGSVESQVACFTYRVKHLTAHLGEHKKDHSAKRGLLKLVGKRKKMLAYLKNENVDRYRQIIAALGLRK